MKKLLLAMALLENKASLECSALTGSMIQNSPLTEFTRTQNHTKPHRI